MGNNQQPKTILETWNEHCIKKSKLQKTHEEFQRQSPEIVRKNAILVLDQAVHSNHLQSYKEEMRSFLMKMNPQKYVGSLAISVYLNHTCSTEFAIPQVNDKKESLMYKQIADYHLIKDLMGIWSTIFKEKYQIFLSPEIKSQLNKIIQSKDFVYQSLCRDVIYFIAYLEQMLKLIYEVKNLEKFKQLIIKMILQNEKVKQIIFEIFQIYSQEQAQIFAKKIAEQQNITLDQLRVPQQYQSKFLKTIHQLEEILAADHPCDKFDLFSRLDQTMISDILNGGSEQVLLELDNQIGIMIYCIIRTQSAKWICQLNFMEMFLGQEIKYNEGKKSIQYSNVLAAIEYIMSNF